MHIIPKYPAGAAAPANRRPETIGGESKIITLKPNVKPLAAQYDDHPISPELANPHQSLPPTFRINAADETELAVWGLEKPVRDAIIARRAVRRFRAPGITSSGEVVHDSVGDLITSLGQSSVQSRQVDRLVRALEKVDFS
jgi:hypothetical protein